MIGAGHYSLGAVIGLAVAKVTPTWPFWLRVIVVFALAWLSHYPGDWIPHGHYHVGGPVLERRKIKFYVLDIIIFPLILLILAIGRFGAISDTFWLIGVGMAGAISPDILEALVQVKLIPNSKLIRAHTHFHWRFLHWHSNPTSPFTRLPRPLRTADLYLVALVVTTLYIIH